MFLFVIISYTIIMFFEAKPILKEKNNAKTIYYFSLTTTSMIISTLLTLEVPLEGPSNLIKDIVISMFGMVS